MDRGPDFFVTPEIDLDAVARIEQRLGLQILQTGEFLPDRISNEQARCDVRKVLYAAGELAVSQGVTARDLQNGTEIPEVRMLNWLNSQTKIANNLAASNFGERMQSKIVDEQSSPRERFQGKLMLGMYEHAQTVPATYYKTLVSGHEVQFSDNLLVVSPTGTGKTVMQATFLREAGIGYDKRGVIVVPDQALHRQYRGDIGDNTFRNWLGPEVEISSYWQYHKESSNKLQIVTRQSIEKALGEEAISPSDTDLVVVDEGHTALAPQLMQQLGKFSRVYYFTATPAYSFERDLRRMFRHVEAGTLTDCIYEGIVNDVELYTFRVANQEEAEQLAAQLSVSEIQDGRKVVVYCRPGQKAKQAEAVAKQINDAFDSDIPAARASFYDSNTDEAIEGFEAGEVKALTTVSMLGQGYNGVINSAVIIGPSLSLLQTTQRIGRALRPNRQFRSRLFEIVPDDAAHQITFWHALGLERVEQGKILGPSGGSWNEADCIFEERKERPFLEKMPPNIREAMLPDQPISQITLSKDIQLNELQQKGYVPVSKLIELHGYEVSEQRINWHLDSKGFRYAGVWLPQKNTTAYERWYEPAALTYLQENLIPPMQRENEMTITAMAKEFEVSTDTLELIVKNQKIKPIKRSARSRIAVDCYTAEAVQQIQDYLKSIPNADPTDVTVGTMRQQLGEKFVIKCLAETEKFGEPTYKRRFAGHGIKGFDLHLTKDQADAMTQAFNEALATDEDIPLLEVAALAGVVGGAVYKSLTEEERAACALKRATVLSRPENHLPRAMGLAVAERLMVRLLPAHLVPLKMATARIAAKDGTVGSAVRKMVRSGDADHGIVAINLGGTNAPSTCMPWRLLETLEQKYGLKEGEEPIDYSKVPHNEQEVSVLTWGYATNLQKKYIDSKKLSESPDRAWRSAEELAEELRCTVTALHILVTQAGADKTLIRKTSEGMTIHSEFIRRLQVVRFRPYQVLEGFLPRTQILERANLTNQQFAEVFKRVELAPGQRKLGLTKEGILDICYTESAARAILMRAQFLFSQRKP